MKKLSLKKAFKNDAVLFSTSITMILFLAIFAYLIISKQDFQNVGAYIIIGIFSIGILLLAIRIFTLVLFKPDNRSYLAKVQKTFIYRSTIYIYLEYTINGQTYKKKNSLISTKYSRSLDIGDEVEIYVAVNNPKRVLIVDAYFQDIEL